jgi:SAM-dependent methyltransferase
MDFVFCASLIEHVTEPEILLSEIKRVMRTDGKCYLSFPPYYGPTGGHRFSPFHYLGERAAIRLMHRRAAEPDWVIQFYGIPKHDLTFSELCGKWGLQKMTIRKFRRLLSRVGLLCLDASTRYAPFSVVRWPLLGELLTWHAQFILAKHKSDLQSTTEIQISR